MRELFNPQAADAAIAGRLAPDQRRQLDALLDLQIAALALQLRA